MSKHHKHSLLISAALLLAASGSLSAGEAEQPGLQNTALQPTEQTAPETVEVTARQEQSEAAQAEQFDETEMQGWLSKSSYQGQYQQRSSYKPFQDDRSQSAGTCVFSQNTYTYDCH